MRRDWKDNKKQHESSKHLPGIALTDTWHLVRVSVVSNMSKLSASSFFMQENQSTGTFRATVRVALHLVLCGAFSSNGCFSVSAVFWALFNLRLPCSPQAIWVIFFGTRNRATLHICLQIFGTTSLPCYLGVRVHGRN